MFGRVLLACPLKTKPSEVRLCSVTPVPFKNQCIYVQAGCDGGICRPEPAVHASQGQARASSHSGCGQQHRVAGIDGGTWHCSYYMLARFPLTFPD